MACKTSDEEGHSTVRDESSSPVLGAMRRAVGTSLLVAGGLFGGSTAAEAQLSVTVGDLVLPANTLAAVVEFHVANTADAAVAVEGLEFNLQVADGGLGSGPLAPGPAITAVDLVEGTSFHGNSPGTWDSSGRPQTEHPWLGIYGTATVRGLVTLPGRSSVRLARVTFDTRGVAGGEWPLQLGATANGPTRFLNVASGGLDGLGNVPVAIREGTVRIAAAGTTPTTLAATWSVQRDATGRPVLETRRPVGAGVVLQSASTLDGHWTELSAGDWVTAADGSVALPLGSESAGARYFRWVVKPGR